MEYMLEIEDAYVDWAVVESAFHDCGVEDVVHAEGRIKSGVFLNSGTFFRVLDSGSPQEISAEEYRLVRFPVRQEIIFRLLMETPAEGRSDIRKFLELLNRVTSFRFVLSYQYENVLAVKLDVFSWLAGD